MANKNRTHLDTDREVSLNSTKKKVKCTKGWYCKRMVCDRCFRHRRDFFVERGAIHAREKGLSKLVTVAWLRQGPSDPWMRLTSLSSSLSKTLSGMRAGPFIRVLSLGERKGTPHIHYFVGDKTAGLIRAVARRKWSGKVQVQIKDAHNTGGLLGYFFDRNFRPSYLDPDRIKGIRLLSASRPMRTGFPTRQQSRELAKLRRCLDQQANRDGSGLTVETIESTGNGNEGSMTSANQ
jgi:hypothetical protein